MSYQRTTKWFARVIVAAATIDTLDSLDLSYPNVSAAKRKELAQVEKVLLGDQVKRDQASYF